MTSAATRNAGTKAATGKLRQFVTPEGVDLELRIASAGSRLAALLLDLIFMAIVLILMTIGAAMMFPSAGSIAGVIWLLGFFLLRNGYFLFFELGKRAATLGKRIVGIRVVAREGGRLTADAVVARNLMRELELFLPLTFLAVDETMGAVSSLTMIFGLVWALCLSLFLLFNKDRMRVGDLIAGTWVVDDPRRKLKQTIDQGEAWQGIVFTRDELAVYGIYELQELERIVRERDPKAMASVADTIRAKLGRRASENDGDFLDAYYGALRAHLERDLLFGKRRENKHQAAE